MTRKEKEEKLLSTLGLKVGDKIQVDIPINGKTNFTICFLEAQQRYCLQAEYDGAYCNLSDLVSFDFTKPMKWRDMECDDLDCRKCPLRNLHCGSGNTLQEQLFQTNLDNEEFEFYQRRIDREYNGDNNDE